MKTKPSKVPARVQKEIKMNKLCKPIKNALAKKYGARNVTVRNGTGTAWGWVHAGIEINKPLFCICNYDVKAGYCHNCRDAMRYTSVGANAIALEALKKESLEPYTYSDDMGGENAEILIEIHFKD